MMLCPACENKLSSPDCSVCGSNGYIESPEEIHLNVPFNMAGEPMYRQPPLPWKAIAIGIAGIYGLAIVALSLACIYLEAFPIK